MQLIAAFKSIKISEKFYWNRSKANKEISRFNNSWKSTDIAKKTDWKFVLEDTS